MAVQEVTASEWARGAAQELALDATGSALDPVVIVHSDGADLVPRHSSTLGPVVILVSEFGASVGPELAAGSDLVLVGRDPDQFAVACQDPLQDARDLARRITQTPVAALTLAWLLRSESWRTLGIGLLSESATYSMLLASEEFERWRASSPARPVAPATARTRVEREGDRLLVTLANPDRRNAMDAHLRDELLEALEVALRDSSVTVTIMGEGPTFCSGGDLAEFGTAPDPTRAHLVRSVASVARALSALEGRVEVRVHGHCFGAGIELPAFASRVVADPDSTFTLPELSMGLIPGAGGTVSLPRRIGRHRAAWWMLSGEHIDATTALAWGLVDGIG